MASKKEAQIIDVPSMVVTSPSMYEVGIKGLDSILFNKMPDQSKPKTEGKTAKQDPLEKEQATWREKAYYEDDGMVYLPGENIHECMKEAAKYWGQKIPGEGNKTYTDVIAKAVICENMNLGIHRDSEQLIPFGKSVNGNPSKGKKSGSKVYKIRPLVRPWGGTFRLHVFDARLSTDVLRVILTYAGTFIGLCDWRPSFGRFELVGIKKLV